MKQLWLVIFLIGFCLAALAQERPRNPGGSGGLPAATQVSVAGDDDVLMYLLQGAFNRKIAAAHFRSNATHYGTTVLRGPVQRITENLPTQLLTAGVDLQFSHNSGQSAYAIGSFIGGGSRNRVGTNNDNTVSGDGAILTGTGNTIDTGVGSDNWIGGGGNNTISRFTLDIGDFSTDCGIGGGTDNTIISSDSCWIGGGGGNYINGFNSTISGGFGNTIAAGGGVQYATIPGGAKNAVTANYATALGYAVTNTTAFSTLIAFSNLVTLHVKTNGGGGGTVEVGGSAGEFRSNYRSRFFGDADNGKIALRIEDAGVGGAPSLCISNPTLVANTFTVGNGGDITASVAWAGTGNRLLQASSGGAATATIPVASILGYAFPIQTSVAASPADSTTYYFGGDDGITIAQAVDYTNSQIHIPASGTLTKVFYKVRTTGTLASTEDVNHFLRINDSTDVAQFTCKYAQITTNFVITASQAVTAGDRIALKVVAPAWATNPTSVRWYVLIYIQ